MKKFKKILIIFIILVLIAVPLSSTFTFHDGKIISVFDNKAIPYKSGTYENYSLCSSPGYGLSGSLNVSSEKSVILVTLDATLHLNKTIFSDTNDVQHIFTSMKIIKKNGKCYYNNSRIFLPFFYTKSNVVSSFGHYYANYTKSDVQHESITFSSGIFQFRPAINIFLSRECLCYNNHDKLLFTMDGCTPLISHGLHLEVRCGNSKLYPVFFSYMVLKKTNVVIFPVDWLLVAASYTIVGFAMTFPVSPVIIIALGFLAYRRHRKRKKFNGDRND